MRGTITSWTSLTHLSKHEGWLETGLGLSVNRLFNEFVATVELSAALLHLSFNPRIEPFTKQVDKVELFWTPVSIKFDENRLELFKVRGPVLDFFNLLLRVSLTLLQMLSTKALESSRFLRKKILKST